MWKTRPKRALENAAGGRETKVFKISTPFCRQAMSQGLNTTPKVFRHKGDATDNGISPPDFHERPAISTMAADIG